MYNARPTSLLGHNCCKFRDNNNNKVLYRTRWITVLFLKQKMCTVGKKIYYNIKEKKETHSNNSVLSILGYVIMYLFPWRITYNEYEIHCYVKYYLILLVLLSLKLRTKAVLNICTYSCFALCLAVISFDEFNF